MSPNIIKAGVGLANDILAFWDDLRSEMVNLVDVGLMARLLLAEQLPKVPFGHMGMQTAVERILGYKIDKEESASDWSAKNLSDKQINCACHSNSLPNAYTCV